MLFFSYIFSTAFFLNHQGAGEPVFLVTCLGNVRSVSYHTKNRMMAGVRLAAVPQNKEGRQVRVTGKGTQFYRWDRNYTQEVREHSVHLVMGVKYLRRMLQGMLVGVRPRSQVPKLDCQVDKVRSRFGRRGYLCLD